MTRQERIAALEEQLANSRKRRSHLLGSLGKSGSEGDGNGTAAGHVTMQQAFSSESVGPTSAHESFPPRAPDIVSQLACSVLIFFNLAPESCGPLPLFSPQD